MEKKTNETESHLLGDSKEENMKVSETAESKLLDQEINNIAQTSEKIQSDQENRNVSETILLDQEPKGNPQVPKKQQLKLRKKIVKTRTRKLLQKQKKKRKENIPEKIKSGQLNDENEEKLDGSGVSQQEEGRKNEEVLQDVQHDEENKDTLDGSETGQQQEKKMTESTENDQSNQIKKELNGCEKNDMHENGKSLPDQSKKEKLDGSEKSQQKEKKKKKQSLQRGRRSEMNRDKHVLPDGDQNNEINKEKHVLSERKQNKGKGKNKPAGIIFMCSSKTKPDCFRYQVMGVSMAKKEIVLSIKPGLKLFLYDFDLKLLYGIYRASSSGGTKLEPAAFGGAFPAQVRFEINKDCFPLPESVFRKAIKENYDKKNKFKTELTAQEVRKLTLLFRPADVRSNAHIITPKREKPRDREPRKKAVDARTHSYGDRYGRGSYLLNVSGVSNVRRDVASTRREELHHESFLSEQEYRTYGLRGKPQSPTPPRHAPVDSYPRDHEHELHLRYPPAPRLHREIVPEHDSSLYEPMLNGREYSRYALSAPLESQFRAPLVTPAALDPYSNDPYPVSQVHALSTNPYGRSMRTEQVYPRSHHYLEGGREIYLPEADHARREIGLGERSYSAYTSDPMPDYRQRYYPSSAASTFAPVSSRYTFAGPSSSRR